MIRSFRHKGLENFFTAGNKKGIRPEHAGRLRDILFRLQFAQRVGDMNFPGSRLHQLRGDRAGIWSITVSGNWRVLFRFDDDHASEVDYADYH
ncbi:MAG TPA: type II toxin-antitoxin system RelE/ParE family toxin [Burkholderiales bacterium]